MTQTLAIAIAQINPALGDIAGNAERLKECRAIARDADLVVAGELVLTGYPPEDLVLKRIFQDHVEAAVGTLARATADGGPALLIGAPWRVDSALRNAALLLDGGEIVAVTLKHELPNYGVFDEMRVFTPGPLPAPTVCRGVRLGVMVCEDMWKPAVSRHLKEAGAEALVVINGSPFEIDKWGTRRGMAGDRVKETGLSLAYVNLVGGQDELVFDGASFVLDSAGAFRVQAPSWRPALVKSLWRRGDGSVMSCDAGVVEPRAEGLEAIYLAMMVGLRDYVTKNRFPGVIIGLSGGIDSALTAAVAVDALGAENVWCVMMPSRYTSQASLEDAAEVARLLGARLDTIGITPAMTAFNAMLADVFADTLADTTEENIQARTRAVVLMALSNKFGHMLLTTGNKSEMSVGYATLYGDMSGGFSVLKDVYKSTVFALSRWRNQTCPQDARGPAGRVIPERILSKAPSAELKDNQTDQDSLPPYDELDAILGCLIEREASVAEIVELGYEEATVRRVWRMIDRAEYKRRQAPPGVKITYRAFGRDRRYPITNQFTDQI